MAEQSKTEVQPAKSGEVVKAPSRMLRPFEEMERMFDDFFGRGLLRPLRFERMPGSGFAWHPWKLVKCIVSQAQAFWFCLRLIRRQRPDMIVGFGGFTSAPVVGAAWFAGVPSALHESNRVPGLAIRTLGRLARRVVG